MPIDHRLVIFCMMEVNVNPSGVHSVYALSKQGPAEWSDHSARNSVEGALALRRRKL